MGEVRSDRGRAAYARGVEAERLAERALCAEGWSVKARRLRTGAGELDLVVEKDGLTAMVEVKARPSLVEAAYALGARQAERLLAAGEAALAENPGWGRAGVRFDVMLVDERGRVRRVADAIRVGMG